VSLLLFFCLRQYLLIASIVHLINKESNKLFLTASFRGVQ
jgi:hypothetical protein